MMPSDSPGSNRHNEPTDRIIKRLQARIADGDDHLRADLAEALMRAAQESAIEDKFEIALKRINEAIKVIRQLVKEGELELNVFVGRALLFRAALTRFHKDPQAGINAFNEAIRHLVETSSTDDPHVQNELAVALMSKADLLIDPLGAYAAALADQEQAAAIWRHLLNRGNSEFRQPFVSALISCSDSKVQNGDPESAIADLQECVEIAEEGVENGDVGIQPLFIQTLLKLARLYDEEGDMDKAFETVRSAIHTVKKLVDSGIEQARLMYTTLHLHLGMLYEKTHNSESALAEFDHCRDVYTEIFREQSWGAAESYAFRTGLANVLMCRGNMLADLKRYPEAEQAFEESVWQYQQAAEYRPSDDDDVTFIPYSIGVVQLNHANLLVAQDKFEEAIALKMKALDALKRRMEAGHSEILPNFLAANRKLIKIWQLQENTNQVFELLNNMIGILEAAVDDGQLEYRIDLALSHRQRSLMWDELRKPKPSLEDALRALRLFRTIADDDRDLPDVHVAKIQWSELLHQIAVLKVKQKRNDEAFNFLKREIADAVRFCEDGNDFVTVDLLLAYTQYINFVEVFGTHLNDLKYPTKKFAQRLQEVQNRCKHGIELSLQKQNENTKNLIAKLFFMMKTAFFYKAEGQLYRLLNNHEQACKSFETSIERWHLLLGGLETLKAKDRYDAAEKGEPMPDWDIPGGANDPYHDRYIFYINELRETMQVGAKAYLEGDRQKDAENLFEKENALTRELMKNGVENADRFLIVSLGTHVRSLLQYYPVEKTTQLYEETLQILQKRFASGEIVGEDFWILKRVVKEYQKFLREHHLFVDVSRVTENTTVLLESVQTFPPPSLWMEVCMALEFHAADGGSSQEALEIGNRHRKLLKRHPEFKTDKFLKRYDNILKKRLGDIKKALSVLPPIP